MLMTMNMVLRQGDDIDVVKKKRGSGLACFEDFVDASIQGLH